MFGIRDISDLITDNKIRTLFLISIIVSIVFFSFVPIDFYKSVVHFLKPAVLGKIVFGLIFLLAFVAALFLIARKDLKNEKLERQNDLKLKFGVYWDNDKNPYCKKCKTPLGAISKNTSGDEFYVCGNRECHCNNHLAFEGNHVKYDEIKGEI